MAMSAARTSLVRKVAVGVTLVALLCAIGVTLILRDLRHMDFGQVVVYKEGVGPSYEETLLGEAD